MATHRIPMKRVKRILVLYFERSYSERRIAQHVGVGRRTVSRTLSRLKLSGLTWAQCKELSDIDLENKLHGSSAPQRATDRPLPDWDKVHRQWLEFSYLTLRMLWLEYKEEHPNGLEYSQFCKRYGDWRRSDPSVDMRLEHRAGDKLFIDYSGKRPSLIDPSTGKAREVELFVAALGASHYVYAEATLTQKQKDVCMSLRRCLEALGGVPRMVVPDNMKTAVARVHRGDVPKINAKFQELADHYDCAVVPARPRHPQDKAIAEKSIQLVQRQILARLRHERFLSLADLNTAIQRLLVDLNARPFQKKKGSRQSWFEEVDKPALRPLPPTPYRYSEWTSKRKVQTNYHVAIQNAYYSVPYKYAGRTVYALVGENTVQIFLDKEDDMGIASHPRSPWKGDYVTIEDYMASHHRAYSSWTPERFIRWAVTFGPNMQTLIEANFGRFRIPEQCYVRCRSLLNLAKKHGAPVMEQAAEEALERGRLSYPAVKEIINQIVRKRGTKQHRTVDHDNIRGATYYGSASTQGGDPC